MRGWLAAACLCICASSCGDDAGDNPDGAMSPIDAAMQLDSATAQDLSGSVDLTSMDDQGINVIPLDDAGMVGVICLATGAPCTPGLTCCPTGCIDTSATGLCP